MMLSNRRTLIVSVLVVLLLVGITALLYWTKRQPSRPTLTIHTYGSFISPFGPGPLLKTLFEETCHCAIEFVNTGDGGFLLQRMKLIADEKVDVVLGLDQLSLSQAKKDFLWRPLKSLKNPSHPSLSLSPQNTFMPYDWSPLTIVYREGQVEPVSSWREFFAKNKDKKLSLQDPRTSSPGMQFVQWIDSTVGRENLNDFFAQLKPRVHSFSSSWSSAYGLFQSEVTDMSFTYITSLVYHWREQNDRRYKAMNFTEGHPVQVEYVGVPERCGECDLARRFVEFLTTDEAQKIIMDKNFMLPVHESVSKGTLFAELPHLKTLPVHEMALDEKEELIRHWKESFR